MGGYVDWLHVFSAIHHRGFRSRDKAQRRLADFVRDLSQKGRFYGRGDLKLPRFESCISFGDTLIRKLHFFRGTIQAIL